jgi:hypothetical protein
VRLVVEKVIVNRQGNILHLELLPPFAYLKRVKQPVLRENSDVGGEKTKTSKIAGQSSDRIPLGVLKEIYLEQKPITNSASILPQMIFPQKKHLLNLLHNRI